MSNFWANRLAGAPAPAQQQPPPHQVQQPPAAPNAPWWLPQRVAPVVPQQQPQQEYAGDSPAPQGQSHIGDLLQQQNYTPSTKAVVAADTERCPSCSSPNFLHIGGLKTRAKRCFDCGFNPMFEQQLAGAGATGIPVVGAPRPARVQTTAAPAGYAPMGTVIGHA